MKIERYIRHKIPKHYIDLAGTDAAITEKRVLKKDELPLEFVMNAFRLIEGVSTRLFSDRTGLLLKNSKKELLIAEELGLIEWQFDELKASSKGLRYLNELLEIFVK